MEIKKNKEAPSQAYQNGHETNNKETPWQVYQNSHLAKNKAIIRKVMKERRKHLSTAEEDLKNEKIFQKIITSNVFTKSECLYCYVSLNHEVSTMKLIPYALAVGKIVAVPKVEGEHINFYYIQGLDDLESGCMKILEPKSSCVRASDEKVLMIIPGLAFDKAGNRIGYGGGYYDRYAESPPHLRSGESLEDKADYYKLGIAFDFQVMDALPVGRYDCRVDQVITD